MPAFNDHNGAFDKGQIGGTEHKRERPCRHLRMGVEHEEINVVVLLPVCWADVFAMLAHEEFVQFEVLANNGFADSGHALLDRRWLMVDGPGKKVGGDQLAEFDGADSAGEHELDHSVTDVFVETHGGKNLLPLRRAQLYVGWQTCVLEESFDALHVVLGQAEERRREFRRGDLANGNRFPVQILGVVGGGFEAVADGWAEIEIGPQAALGLVLPNHIRFDLAAAGDDGRQRARVAPQQLWQITFQVFKEPGVVNDAVLDHFGEARAVFAHGQRGEGVQVAEHQPGLMEGTHEVLARLEVQPDFAAYGAVHLCEQG